MKPTTIRNPKIRNFLAAAAVSLGVFALTPASTANAQSLDDILTFFDDSVADGTLVGVGRRFIAKIRLALLRTEIVTANLFFNFDLLFDEGCVVIFRAETRTDGQPDPRDFVEGSSAPILAQKIDDFRKFTGCSVTTVAAGEGGTIEGESGTSITVEAGAVPYEAAFGIEPALATQVVADDGGLGIAAAVEITFASTGPSGSIVPPSQPFQLSIPAGAELQLGDQLVVGRQVEVFEFDGSTPVKNTKFQAVASATVVETLDGNVIQTQPGVLPGIFSGGIFSFIVLPDPEPTGAGNSHTAGDFPGTATGRVTTSGGANAVGATVSSSAAPWIALTDPAGMYTIPVIAAELSHEFTVQAFAPLTGEVGAFTGTFPDDIPPDSLGTNPNFSPANIALDCVPDPLSPSICFPTPPAHDGIRNGGFESGTLSSWIFDDGSGGPASAAFVSQSFGPTGPGTTCTGAPGAANPTVCVPPGFPQNVHPGEGTVISPTEGDWMAVIATGPGGATASTRLRQSFVVPRGVNALRFQYNFVSEEFPEFVNTIFNDTFSAVVTNVNVNDPTQSDQITPVTVNALGTGVTPIGDCGFTGGDASCSMTDWQTAVLQLPGWASGAEVTVELVFSATDAGDSVFDTFVFLDNIRFSTLWLDVKTLSDGGTNATGADGVRIKADVKRANEILSQAGVNVQLRRHPDPTDPLTLLPFRAATVATAEVDVDVTYNQVIGSICTVTEPAITTADPFPGETLEQFHAFLNPDETTVVNTLRSTTAATDLNVYYARNSEETTGCSMPGGLNCQNGYSLGPDDFCVPPGSETDGHDHVTITESGGVVTQTNSGVLMFDVAASSGGIIGGDVLAHEIIHILLNPWFNDSRQEHGPLGTLLTNNGFGEQTDTSNIMLVPQSTGKINITRTQSAFINLSPLLVD